MPARNTTSDSPSLPSVIEGSDFFRKEAVEHHFRDSESAGVVSTSFRWTWFTLLVSSLLVIAALLFLYFTQIDVPTSWSGSVQVGDSTCAAQAVGVTPHVIAFTTDARVASLHAGDDVRVEVQASWHARPVFFDGRLSKIIPAVGDSARNQTRRTPNAPARMEIEFIAPAVKGDTLRELHDGMAVVVHAANRKQRLIEYSLASFKGSIR